jgi:hypothetical protein
MSSASICSVDEGLVDVIELQAVLLTAEHGNCKATTVPAIATGLGRGSRIALHLPVAWKIAVPSRVFFLIEPLPFHASLKQYFALQKQIA